MITGSGKITTSLRGDGQVNPQFIVKSGIAFKPIDQLVDTVSYNIYDYAWQQSNGYLEHPYQPTNPIATQEIDFSSVNPFNTLKYPNIFGHYGRFTSKEGHYMKNDVFFDDTYGLPVYTQNQDYVDNTGTPLDLAWVDMVNNIESNNLIIFDHLYGVAYAQANIFGNNSWEFSLDFIHNDLPSDSKVIDMNLHNEHWFMSPWNYLMTLMNNRAPWWSYGQGWNLRTLQLPLTLTTAPSITTNIMSWRREGYPALGAKSGSRSSIPICYFNPTNSIFENTV